MGDMIKAISEDIEAYKELCEHFGEPVQHSFGSPDCYGKHAKELQRRYDEEQAKWKNG